MANKCEAYGGGYCDNEYVVSVRDYMLCKRCAAFAAQHHVEEGLKQLDKAIKDQAKLLKQFSEGI